ncbi:integrase core domain-containing protein [Gimesia panareensis]|uniref:integrase core domain-containing protein n=1 Tax=Gimesia panareensis TaxID=2527978 RepID=UPI0011A68722
MRVRQECLNQHWFLSEANAQKQIDQCRLDYNENGPHSSLGNQTPVEFAKGSSLARRGCISLGSLTFQLLQGWGKAKL